MKRNQAIERISWAKPEDSQMLAPLFLALYAHEVPEAETPPPEDVAAHIGLLIDPLTPHQLAIAWGRDGSPIALAAAAVFLSVSNPRRDHWRQVEIKELFVLPEYRGQEIGTTLLDWVESWARANGASRMDWHVKSENHSAISFYHTFGAHVVSGRLSMRKRIGKA